MMGFINQSDITIYLLNLDSQKTNGSNFVSLIGDATDLSQFSDNSFDLVFSNSVIEHLFTWENQVKMANEVMRVGNNHFIQTPNFWFPIEPHFVFPFFQFLPKPAKILLMLRFRLGNFDKFQNKTKAEEKVHEIQLLRVC